MENNQKRSLLSMTYFTTILFMVVFAVIFGIFLGNNITIGWAKVAYYIWLVVIVLNTAYDVICVVTRKNKYMPGVIFYIITIITLVVSIILFFSFAEGFVILPAALFGYISCVFLSYFVNALAICIYCMGQNLINLRTY